MNLVVPSVLKLVVILPIWAIEVTQVPKVLWELVYILIVTEHHRHLFNYIRAVFLDIVEVHSDRSKLVVVIVVFRINELGPEFDIVVLEAKGLFFASFVISKEIRQHEKISISAGNKENPPEKVNTDK